MLARMSHRLSPPLMEPPEHRSFTHLWIHQESHPLVHQILTVMLPSVRQSLFLAIPQHVPGSTPTSEVTRVPLAWKPMSSLFPQVVLNQELFSRKLVFTWIRPWLSTEM